MLPPHRPVPIMNALAHDPTDCDVLIIGAGPAGASAATILAEHGHRIHLLAAEQLQRDPLRLLRAGLVRRHPFRTALAVNRS